MHKRWLGKITNSMNDFIKEKSIKFFYWIVAILIVIAIPYSILFILDFGLNKFQPVAVVFTSLMFLAIGTFFLELIKTVFSIFKDRLDTLKRVYGEKRVGKEIKIYYLIAFTAITVWVSQTLVEFLLSMLIAGLITLLIVLINNFKIVRKNNKKEG